MELNQLPKISARIQASVTNAVCPGGGGGVLLQCSAQYMPILSVFVRSH